MPRRTAAAHVLRMPAPVDKRRAADIAYDRIETLIATLRLEPGAPVVETELAAAVGLGRTPVREALMQMISIGLVLQQPRRGLFVSRIDLLDYFDLIATRRALEQIIALASTRRATPHQRQGLLACAQRMTDAAARGDLDAYMAADQALDHLNYEACRNRSAAKAVAPFVVQCRRFWYAYRNEGDIVEGAACHLRLARGIADHDETEALAGVADLMACLERFAQRVIKVGA